MNIPNLKSVKSLVAVGKAFVITHRPELLLGTSIAATVTSTVLAAKGGYEARGIIEAEKSRREFDGDKTKTGLQITPKEHIKLTWQCYLPSAFALTTSIGSTTGLHLVHVKDKRALVQASVLAIEETKEIANQYRNELLAVSPEKAADVENKIHEKRSDENGISRIMNTDGVVEDFYLVRDPITGRDIWSNRIRIEQAMLEVGNVINGSENADLNMFYTFAGWSETKNGGKLGWSGVLPEISWVDGSGPIGGVRDDGRPFVSFRFRPEPTENYDSGS